MQLNGKKIVVTGGTKGIGAGTVKAYVREGAQVVFCGTNDQRGKAVEAEANAQGGGHATYVHCDVSDQAEVNALFDQAEQIMGGLDVLAHIAGVEHNSPAELFTRDVMEHLTSINFYGTVFANQAAYRLFQKHNVEGAIINYASDTGMVGMPNGGIYAGTKAAVLGWTRTIAFEWAKAQNVRCNCVCPAIKTPMYQAWLDSVAPEVKDPYLASLKDRFPIDGDMGDIDRDLAPVMVFLASDASRYINGQTICVNGGLVMVR